jgi:hypothetical protein
VDEGFISDPPPEPRRNVMKRLALLMLAASLLGWWTEPAVADPMRGPLRVMRPDGTVFQIDSPAVKAWWRDYRRGSCVSCGGPQRAARLLHRVERALGSQLRAGPRYLILPEVLELDWPRAWLFYPSSDSTPAYVVNDGGVGGSDNTGRWDAWTPATSSMEAVILEASGDAGSAGTLRGDRGGDVSMSIPGWIPVVALLSALAISRPGSARKRWARSPS